MGWHGHLHLHYRRDEARTVARHRHDGPLRVLASLYPEAPEVCHQVLVHPPGGIVGGDRLDIDVALDAGSHALVTTPGATRFYRSAGSDALQQLAARVGDGARLEWLPLENIVYRGAQAENRMRFELAPGGEMIGWDVLALGLPASGEAFDRGRFVQQLEIPGRWLERGVIDGADGALLDSPLGWAGHRVLATLWFAAGGPLARERRDALLDTARELAQAHPLAATAGVTAPHDGIVVLRALAPRVEPVMELLTQVWARWRETAWQLPACAPRVWRT
ncbi:urease accessory protein UreD [Caldimonas tepidiphila]|uniref:urease accessory protein UreD n=1 Tax=Caldimonas tepidiphila TaxID=2315841 RepID=UPI000E5C16B4|nr:urease accessory protein UreD [Caldimonas tepidiphila]